MRRALTLLSAVVGVILSPLAVLGGQSSNFPPGVTPDQPFAAVTASLLNAVDSAIETAPATPSLSNLPAQPPKVQPLTSPVASLDRALRRVDPHSPIVQAILAREGVPSQLAAVIQIESGGNSMAMSSKGARGLWQLMPDTARRYGLRVDDQLDERLDIEKATTGAARYLKDLYVQFGSWPLALAAYNTGEVNLQRAIDRAHSRDFSVLIINGHLPLETRNYVPAVIAAMALPFPSSVPSSQKVHPLRFVYATSDESGE